VCAQFIGTTCVFNLLHPIVRRYAAGTTEQTFDAVY